MEPTDIKRRVDNIRAFLKNKEIKNALDALNKLVRTQPKWSYSEKLSELDTHYRYMLHYIVEGEKDPQRESVYNKLLRDIYTLTDDVAEEHLMHDSPQFFYEKSRVEQARPPMSVDLYADALAKQTDTFSFIHLLDERTEKENRLRQNQLAQEVTIKDMFYTVYVSPRSTVELTASIERFLQNEVVPPSAKGMLVTALTLNVLQRFDAPKVLILLDACRHPQQEPSTRALVGLIPIFQAYRALWQYYPECRKRFKLLSDDPTFNRRFMSAITGYIQAHETEKITKKLTEEILPEMMKLSPIIGKKIKLDEWMGESGMDDKNPEWQKIIDESGLSDKLQELTELQMEGADVFHSTFSNMKSYPFFREMSNWFLPFTPRHSSVASLFGNKEKGTSLLETLFDSPVICDSDKYSFCLSMQMMPENYRQMLANQLGGEADEIKKLQSEELALNPHQEEVNLINQSIRNLYRFYKLYPRRAEFMDIFALPLNYHQIEAFYPVVKQRDNLERIALYYFEKNNFNEAISAYTMLSESGSAKSETWQKIGYAKQMLGDVKGALDAYLHADLIEENNTWLLNRIAYCYRVLKEPQTALSYYRRLEQFRPDDLSLQLNIGHCYLELKQYDEALNKYFKVELLDANSSRAWRPIAWCAFLSRKFDVSRDYYQRIMEKKPTAHDYLNAGHVALCLGNIKKAVSLYNRSLEKTGSMDEWKGLLIDDKEELLQAGIDGSLIPFILDKMRYDEADKKAGQ